MSALDAAARLTRHSPVRVRAVACARRRQLLEADAVVELRERGPHLAELPVAPGELRGMETDRGECCADRSRASCRQCPDARPPTAAAAPAADRRPRIDELQPLELEVPRRLRIAGTRQRDVRPLTLGPSNAIRQPPSFVVRSSVTSRKRCAEIVDPAQRRISPSANTTTAASSRLRARGELEPPGKIELLDLPPTFTACVIAERRLAAAEPTAPRARL